MNGDGVRRRVGGMPPNVEHEEMKSSAERSAAVDVKKQLTDLFKSNEAAAAKLMIAGLRFVSMADSNNSIFSRAHASLSKDAHSQQKAKMFTCEMDVIEICRQLNINSKNFFTLITPCSGLFNDVIPEDLKDILTQNLKIRHVRGNHDVLDFLLTNGFFTDSEDWAQKYGKIRMS